MEEKREGCASKATNLRAQIIALKRETAALDVLHPVENEKAREF